jgi:hypothetical protein
MRRFSIDPRSPEPDELLRQAKESVDFDGQVALSTALDPCCPKTLRSGNALAVAGCLLRGCGKWLTALHRVERGYRLARLVAAINTLTCFPNALYIAPSEHTALIE